MRLAIVCDDLIQFGGAEKLVMAVSEIWPDAPIYTSVASEKWQDICRQKNIKLKTSFMQRLPFVEKLNRYYSPFLLHCLAFESFNLNDFDVVLSMSSRFAHGVITQPQTKHICYMNSPGRMFWEADNYFEKESYGTLKFLKFLARPFLSLSLSILKLWDYTASHRVDYFIANSKTPQARIKKYYGIDASIIYPFVDVTGRTTNNKGNYYLAISRMQSWKRLDIVVEACSRLNLPLKIIGDGPDFINLKNLAGTCVEFLGYVRDERKNELLGGCTALIQAQKEDFGIVSLEALSFGKPVIAFGEGGVLETITPGITGEFFYEQTPESLIDTLKNFEASNYNSKQCKESIKSFTKKKFQENIKGLVNNVYLMSTDLRAL